MASYGNIDSESQMITVMQSESNETQNPFTIPIAIAAMAAVVLLIIAVVVVNRRKEKKPSTVT
jgi:hypothetical protein